MTKFEKMFGGVASLLVMSALVGCGGGTKPDKGGTVKPADEHAHAHPSSGPHKGQLIELGAEEYHAEMVDDDAAHKLTFYLLDSKAKDAVTSDEPAIILNITLDGKPAQYRIPAAPQAGETGGKTSRYETADEVTHDALEKAGKARFGVKIGGKSFTGDIEHHAH